MKIVNKNCYFNVFSFFLSTYYDEKYKYNLLKSKKVFTYLLVFIIYENKK